MLKKIILLVMLLLITGCAPKSYKLLQDKSIDSSNSDGAASVSQSYDGNIPAKIDYRILKNDRLAITIYQHPDLIPPNSNGILVDSNGDISLPLIHRVHVAGLTQTEAAKMLERRYSKYLRNPALNLEVLNKRIYVLGEVKKPGPIKVDKEYMTILQAIASAGDLTDHAVRNNIIVISTDANGKMHMRRLDLTNFNKLQASNIIIKPNDIIYVQPDSSKEFKLNTTNMVYPLQLISNIVSPFATVKALTD